MARALLPRPFADGAQSVQTTLAANAPAFDILINYTGDSRYLSFFTAAERMWELVITADLPNVTGLPSPAPTVVDDLFINASATSIDGSGGILGQAGPELYRPSSYLPSIGVMEFDSADLAGMVINGTLKAVILHEMGHVLGIGTMWGDGLWDNVTNIGTPTSPNYRYTGSAALAEYRILANNPSASFVPVENSGGGGTAGGHWDEAIFGNELMTGYINGASAPLSRMSIAALRDAGYTVDLGTADPYWLVSTAPGQRDDYAGNYNASTVVGVGRSVTGAIELNEDNDWFVVSLTSGTSYTFTMQGAPSGKGTLTDSFIRLRAADGEVLAFNDNSATNADSVISFTATATGSYFLDASAAGTQTGTYTVSFAASAPPTTGLFTDRDDTVTLTSPGGTWSALGGVDRVTGTAGADIINGDAGNDVLNGAGGSDTLRGGDGADQLNGGDGDDTIYADRLDMALSGGNGNDVLIVVGTQSGALSLGLAANGFESGRVVTTGTSSTTWMEITENYIGNWVRTSQNVVNYDGTKHDTFFDHQRNQGYTEYTNYYLDTGTSFKNTVTRQFVFEDAGTKQERFFDYINNRAYTEYINYYLDTSPAYAGSVTRQVVFEDPGTKQERFFDYASNQAYREYINFYADTTTAYASRVTRQMIFEDAGTKQERLFDYKGDQRYVEYINYYTQTSGAFQDTVTRQVVFEDAGTKQERILDWNNTQTYSEYVNYYNAAGTVVRQVGFADTGGTVLWDYVF